MIPHISYFSAKRAVMMRVAIYMRVSTTDQNIENQLRELQAVAARANWEIVEVFEDYGVSGAKGRDKRPAFDRMCRAITQRKVHLVAAWSIDRLGRSLQHLVAFLGELRVMNCDLYLHQQQIDTTTPSGRAMFQMMGVFAEFEREMIRERVNAGLARTVAKGTVLGRGHRKDVERWGMTKAMLGANVKELRLKGMGKMKIAKTLGVGTGTVQRILEA